MKKTIYIFITFLTIILSTSSYADTKKPITMDEAFQFTATARDAETFVAHFKIRPGYYLYKNHMKFRLEKPEQGKLSAPILPVGLKKHVEDLGVFEVYTDVVQIGVPFKAKPGTNSVELVATYQGCADDGYCYPPTSKLVHLDLKTGLGKFVSGKTVPTEMEEIPIEPDKDDITSIFTDKKMISVLLTFFGFGLLLAFTPCVLPMIPILSSIIVGQKEKLKTSHAFFLSLIYVLSMSITYAAAGILVGYVGSSVQVMFQQPWIIVLSSLIFVGMALSLFGFYELRLPASIQNKITNLSNKQRGGTYLGVAIMGCLATLIVSPCVTPALVGALGYIGESGDSFLGGAALFCLGLGMGAPLIAIGTAGGKILPKAGNWMNSVSKFVGVIMLAMAIWMLDRILPGQYTMALWAALLIVTATYLGAFKSITNNDWEILWKGCGMVLLIYGSLLMFGAALGNTDPLHPLHGLHLTRKTLHAPTVAKATPVKSVDDVDSQIEHSSKMVLLDFYADWCVSCKLMERNTFDDPKVQSLLQQFTLLKANVTQNNKMDKKLQHQYGVIAPPTFVFIKPNGEELKQFRVVGEMNAEKFAKLLQNVLDSKGKQHIG